MPADRLRTREEIALYRRVSGMRRQATPAELSAFTVVEGWLDRVEASDADRVAALAAARTPFHEDDERIGLALNVP